MSAKFQSFGFRVENTEGPEEAGTLERVVPRS